MSTQRNITPYYSARNQCKSSEVKSFNIFSFFLSLLAAGSKNLQGREIRLDYVTLHYTSPLDGCHSANHCLVLYLKRDCGKLIYNFTAMNVSILLYWQTECTKCGYTNAIGLPISRPAWKKFSLS